MKTKYPLVVSNKDWQDLIGIQFALGGKDKTLGLNCYGVVREMYKLLEIELPERDEQTLTDTIIESEQADWLELEEPEPYCVAVIKVSPLPGQDKNIQHYHLGVITPDMQLLHVLVKKGVVVSHLEKYQSHIIGYYKYQPGAGGRLPVGDGEVGRWIGSIVLVIAALVATFVPGLQGFAPGLWVAAITSIVGTAVSYAFDPSIPRLENKGPAGDSGQYAWDGITNNFRQGANKGLLIGTIRVGGQILSEKTWFDGDTNEYLDMLICPCVGPITRFADVEINDTGIELYKDCTAVLRPGDDEQTPIPMFNKIYIQYMAAAKLSTGYTQFATKTTVEGFRIVLAAPQGLYNIDGGGNAIADNVVCHVQYSTNAATWIDLPTGDATYPDVSAPFYDRTSGSFSGTSNPFSLQDTLAKFDEHFTSTNENFLLIVGGTTYYCTFLEMVVDSSAIEYLQFNAFTDSARTTPATGAIADGAYIITDDTNISKDVSDFSGRIVTGFHTNIDCQSIKFTVRAISSVFSWMQLKVWYREDASDGLWTLHNVFDAGTYNDGALGGPVIGVSTRTFEIEGLQTGKYQVVLDWTNDSLESETRLIDNIGIVNVFVANSYVPGTFTVRGNTINPMHLTQRTIELTDLPLSTYYFRLNRETEDESGTVKQNSVYLRSYAEIIDKNLAYPNNALMGIRAMATDRLYGGRPIITAIATGAPLSVPKGKTTLTTINTDVGIVAGSGTLVNGVNVDGKRKLTLSTALPTAQTSGKYYWLVRMDSSGYAQYNRLLTKWFCRVHAWSGADIYIENTEGIPATTSVMLFHEDDAPTNNLAWAITKLMIVGSHGRITADKIDWTSFSTFNNWCESQGFKCNALIDFTSDLWTVVYGLCMSGRGWLIAGGGKYKVAINRASTAVQLFSEGNSKNAQIDFIPTADRANILVTDFLNSAKNYDSDTISEEDVQGNEYPIVLSLPLQIGVTSEAHARKLLKFGLKQNRYIGRQITFDAGIDSIETEIGDVFAFASQAHDFCISGRLRNVFNGEVTLDRTFTPTVGVLYKLTIWPKDSVPVYWTGYLTGTDIETIQTTLTITMDEYYQYPYMLGKLSEEKSRYRCLGITRKAETLEATIKGIEYRDECFEDD